MNATQHSPDSRPGSTPTAIDALTEANGRLYWIEERPTGDVLVTWRDGQTDDALPAGTHVASTVHEYGGGAYVTHTHRIWFVRAEDQRVWRGWHGTISPLSPEARHREHRHGDLQISPNGRFLVCVRERHTGNEINNELVSMPANEPAEPTVIAHGEDFYSSPTISPTGTQLAWISWNTPQMPWDGTRLWTAELHPDATLGTPILVAGGDDEAISQPRYDPEGVLHFLSDRNGWTNLYRHHDGHTNAVIVRDAELGPAAWEFGYTSYLLLPNQRIATTVQQGPHTRLALTNTKGVLEPIPQLYTSFKPYLAGDHRQLAAIGATPTQTPTLALINTRSGAHQELTAAIHAPHSDSRGSPELIRFPTRDNSHAHAVLHSPAADTASAQGLLVRAHPGPTANAQLRLDPWILFFTSHGYTVLDVDYRGSTGYGRTYRNALRHRWGEIDVADCVDAVTHLAYTRRINPTRVAICGSSAGAYTALRALETTKIFSTACVRHALIDPATWARTAPKFQAHHATLLAPLPTTPTCTSATSSPLLMIHGGKDTVTSINDVREFAAQHTQATLVVYPDEAHGLRCPKNITHALHTELAHIHRHIGP